MSEQFTMGKQAALNDVAALIDNGQGISGVNQAINDTLNAPMQKQASAADRHARMGVEAVCYDLLKTACEYEGAYDVQDEDRMVEDVFKKVASDGEIDPSQLSDATLMGKQAALNEMAEMADEGHGLESLCARISETVNAPLQKQASEQDRDFRRGVEAACYGFLKEANDYYDTYDVQNEHQAVSDVILKVAENIGDKIQNIEGRRQDIEGPSGKKPTGGQPMDPNREDPGKMGRFLKNIQKKTRQGAGAAAEKVQQGAGAAADAIKNNPGKAVGGAAAGAAGLYGLNKLRQKMKGDGEEQQQKAASQKQPQPSENGHQKEAGLQYTEEDIEESLEVLDQAGLLE